MRAKPSQPRLNRQILDEAAAWFVGFRVGDSDASTRAHFDQWLRRSPEHVRAYIEIAKTYVELPAIKSDSTIDTAALIARARADSNLVPFSDVNSASTSRDSLLVNGRPRTGTRRTRVPPRWSLVACGPIVFAAAALLTSFWWNSSTTYQTDFGESRWVTLSDGSTIALNARSKIQVSFSQHERSVELIAGQVLFEVAKDARRPFVVRSRAAMVRAVGTQFDVYKRPTSTTVTVAEGRVVVQRETQPDPGAASANPRQPAREATYVSAGEQVTVTAQSISRPHLADVTAATAWTQHRLIFDGARLRDLAEDLNRYNRRPS